MVYVTVVLALEEDGVVENDRLSFETEFFSSAARAQCEKRSILLSTFRMPCFNAMFNSLSFNGFLKFLSTLVVPVCRQFPVLSLHEQTRMLL